MKCSKCGNDLGIESNSAENVKYCSSCEKHDFPKSNSIEEVLRWIVQNRGVEVFQNSGVINAILSDLAPKDEKGRMKIKNALAVRAGEYFYGIVQQGTLNEVSRKQFLSDLSSNGFTIEFCNFIFDVFAYSINQSVAVQEKETTKTTANDAYENIVVNTEQNNENVSHNMKTDTKRDKKGIVKGKFITSNGMIYEGEFLKEDKTGKGKKTSPNGIIYEGEFLEGYLNGRGKMTYPSGAVYEGEFQKGFKTGKGKMTFSSGVIYEGQLVNICPNGEGKMIWPDGVVYEGEFENGLSEGRGKQTWPDGRTYIGEWHKDQRHGKGTMTWPDGVVYEGEFLENMRQGKGAMTWLGGDKFVGEFLNDKIKKGIYTFADGRVYEGEFEKGLSEGRGKQTWADGRTYIGEWHKDQRHGKGTMTWLDGTIYDGDWKNDKCDGTGITTLPNKQQYLQTYSQGNLINERELEITDSKNLKLNALKQCTENRQIVGKDIRIPLPIILKFGNFDGYRLFSISNEHYSYGIRDFTKHKLEGFWKDFKPYGYMRRTTQGETWIEYYDEDGNFVKKFTKNELPKIFQFTSKIRMNYFNVYDADIENSSSLVYVEYETKNGNGYRGTTQLFSNKQQGFGVAHYTSGNKFYGKFQEGVPSVGIMLDSDGTILRGTFKDGLLKGEGMVQWANGDIYEGDFQEGVRTGRGIIKRANGSIYEGDFVNGIREGKGKQTWSDGSIYEGDFLSNQCHGEGTMIWPDGTIYDGDWKDGKRDGTGITTLPNKQQYLQTYSQGNLINEREL